MRVLSSVVFPKLLVLFEDAAYAEQCTADDLTSIVAPIEDPLFRCTGMSIARQIEPLVPGDLEGMEQNIVCNYCSDAKVAIQDFQIVFPTCHLLDNMTYAEYSDEVFAYCAAKDDMADHDYTVNTFMWNKIMDPEKTCIPQAISYYFRKEWNILGKCGDLLLDFNCYIGKFDDSFLAANSVLSASTKKTLCTLCPGGVEAIKKRQLPKCKTPFNLAYDDMVKEAFSVCAPDLKFDAIERPGSIGGGDGLGLTNGSSLNDVNPVAKPVPSPSPSHAPSSTDLIAAFVVTTGLSDAQRRMG